MLANESMVLSKRTVAVAAALLMALALASVDVALHAHDTDAQSAGYAGCHACHFRHVSAVETDRTPAPSELELVAHAVASTHPDGELGSAFGVHPTRGPPV